MLKECIVLNGEIINIGTWDYQPEQVEVSPAVIDDEGKELEPAAYETVERNPLPEGAEIVELEVYQDDDGAWRQVGYEPPLSEMDEIKQQLALAQAALDDLILGGGL